MPDFADRYVHVTINGEIDVPAQPLPFFVNDRAGNPHESSTMTEQQLRDIGWLKIEQRQYQDIDPGIQVAARGVVFWDGPIPVEQWQYEFVPGARDVMAQRIDEAAERKRGQLAVSAPLQVKEYDEAYDEAVRYLAQQDHSGDQPGDWPFLEADLGRTKLPDESTVQTLDQAAALIVATRDAWRLACAQIRTVRLGGKAAVRDAMTDEHAYTLMKACIQSLA
jgi:hypothetical protein